MGINIKFTDVTNTVAEDYYPKPARYCMPEWYLNLESNLKNNGLINGDNLTAKRCVPMFDALSSGYILFTVVDILISHDEDGKLFYNWPDGDGIEFQQNSQIANHKKITKEYGAIPKMPNPWAITTNPGYSCLFIPPMNRDDSIFEIFSGVIDTDTFNINGSFPFRLIDPTFNGLIPAGTPMAQVIPFKRQSYKMSMGNNADRDISEKQLHRLRSVFINGYRNLFWSKKSYK